MTLKKLSITIPSELAERLEPHRDHMNLPEICAAAIERELSILADLPQEVQEQTKLTSRLRTEKASMEQRDYRTGFEHGQAWAEHATYDDFRYYELRYDEIDFLTWHDLPDEVQQWLQCQAFDAEPGLGAEVAAWDAYARDWVDGLMSVWDIVRSEVQCAGGSNHIRSTLAEADAPVDAVPS